MNHNNIVDIVGQIYESVAYDDIWEDVLSNISVLLKSHFCFLTITDRQANQTSIISHLLDSDEIDTYQNTIYKEDELRDLIENSPVGSIKRRNELIDTTDYLFSNYYQNFLLKQSGFYCLSCCFYRDSQLTASVSFFRRESETDFDNRDKQELGVFIPHFTRAFTISAQTKVANLQAQVQAQIKDTTDAALFLIMENNISIPMNNKAFELISSTPFIAIAHDRLIIKNNSINKKLQELIKKCVVTAQGKDMFPGGFIRVESHIEGTSEWHLSVTPYRSGSAKNALKARGALVIIRQINQDIHDKLDLVLSDFYGLTAAETQVLIKMISGLSTPEISTELGLSKECIRSRLKKIYEKTGVSNQVQLTHNILEGPYKLANMLG